MLPCARQPRATGATGDGGFGGRVGGSSRGRAHLGDHRYAPPPTPPQTVGDRGCCAWQGRDLAWRGSAPSPWSVPRQRARGWPGPGQKTQRRPPAAGAGLASLEPRGSNRWAGSGAGRPLPAAPRPPPPQNPSKNSLPPGRLPGLLPSPSSSWTLTQLTSPRIPLSPPVSLRPPSLKAGPQEPGWGSRASGYLCPERLCFLVPLSQVRPGNTCPREPQNPAGQWQQAAPARSVDARIHVPEMAEGTLQAFNLCSHQKPAKEPSSPKAKEDRWQTSVPRALLYVLPSCPLRMLFVLTGLRPGEPDKTLALQETSGQHTQDYSPRWLENSPPNWFTLPL